MLSSMTFAFSNLWQIYTHPSCPGILRQRVGGLCWHFNVGPCSSPVTEFISPTVLQQSWVFLHLALKLLDLIMSVGLSKTKKEKGIVRSFEIYENCFTYDALQLHRWCVYWNELCKIYGVTDLFLCLYTEPKFLSVQRKHQNLVTYDLV